MKHVLIMEDNMSLAFEWRDVFELNGHKVTLSHNGEDAIAHLDDTKFDLVVTDMFVPNQKGGLHILGKLMIMKTKAPPVIAVTGTKRYTESDDEKNFFLRQAEQFGTSETLEKPFAAGELVLIAEKIWNSL